MSVWRLLQVFAVAVGASVLAACSTPINLGNVFPGSGSTTATPATAGTIAFEPVVGIPAALAGPLAAELTAAATGQRLTVVGRDDARAAHRAKGYFSAETIDTGTRITYVWDLFDAAGQRKTRFQGERIIDKRADDPWSTVDQEMLRAIARWTIDQIATATGTQAASGSETAPPAPASQAPQASQASQASPTAQAAPAEPARRPQSRAALAMADGRIDTLETPQVPRQTAFAIGTVRASGGDGSRVLPGAMSDALKRNGATLAADGAATHVVSGEARVAAGTGDLETVTLVWTLHDQSGNRLGSVRQEKTVPRGALASTWQGHVEDAADAAAPGLIALAAGN